MTNRLETDLAPPKPRNRKTTMRDGRDRPIVVVTGMGVITSLGEGKTENWKKLTAGESGISTIRRFSTNGLKTRIAGTIDFVEVKPFIATIAGQSVWRILSSKRLSANPELDERAIFRVHYFSVWRQSKSSGRNVKKSPGPLAKRAL